MPLAVLGSIVIAFVSPLFVSNFFFFSLREMLSLLFNHYNVSIPHRRM
jgi:hypothetical protein